MCILGLWLGQQSVRWSTEGRTVGPKAADIISHSCFVTYSVLQSLWMSWQFSSIVCLKRSPSFKCHHSILFQLCCFCSSQTLWNHWNYPERFPWPNSLVFQWLPQQIPNNGGSFSKVGDTSWSKRLYDGCLLLTTLHLLGILYLSHL